MYIYIYLKLDIQKVMLGRYELECELKKKKKDGGGKICSAVLVL